MRDRVGFDEYVAAAWPRLLRSAWVLTADWSLAEDLLQTALLKTYARWPLAGDGSPDAYVRRVLATTYVSWWRRRWRGEVPTAELPEPDPPADPHEHTTVRMGLAAALAALPRQQRAVLMLRYHADLTEAATAQALGLGVGTVKRYTARALAALRARPDIQDLLMEGTTP
jgi:RNA polymerase sigma-70 factor (sigma-E family)